MAVEYFNGKGILIKKIIRDSTGGETIEKTLLFDSNGKEITSIVKYGNLSSNRTDGVRDRSGNLVELKSYELNSNADTTTDIFLYQFNKDSTIVYSQAVDKEDNSRKVFYEELFDNKKRLLQQTIKIPSGAKFVTESIDKYSYDERGNKVSHIRQNLVDNITSRIIYVYDAGDNLIKESYFKNDSLVYEIDYKYEGVRKKEAVKRKLIEGKRSKMLFVYS